MTQSRAACTILAMKTRQILIPSSTDMLALGARLAQAQADQYVLFLQGQLGAGKTTLVRGMLQALEYQGAVKSPTYTLVETYHLANRTIFHWDMYRLTDSVELENIGIRDYLQQPAWWLVEWAEHVKDILPPADLLIKFVVRDEARELDLTAKTPAGKILLEQV